MAYTRIQTPYLSSFFKSRFFNFTIFCSKPHLHFSPQNIIHLHHYTTFLKSQSPAPNSVMSTSSTSFSAESRLTALRAQFKTFGIGMYVVLTQDEHNSEYTSPADNRREFISGMCFDKISFDLIGFYLGSFFMLESLRYFY